MRADLRHVLLPDPPEQRDPVLLQLLVGPLGEEGEESFEVVLYSPESLARLVAETGPVLGAHMMFMPSVDVAVAIEALRARVNSIEGETWDDLVVHLAQIGRWEFDENDVGQPLIPSETPLEPG